MEIVIVKLTETLFYFKSMNEEDNIRRFESVSFKREPESITHMLSIEASGNRVRK